MALHTGEHTLVVIDAGSDVPATYRASARVVRTSLDLVLALEEQPRRVILVGGFARERSFAAFIREIAPSSEVLAVEDRTSDELAALELCCA